MIFLFFNCLSSSWFLLIEFYCTFSISYKIIYYVYYYCIFIWLLLAVGTSVFSCFASFRTHALLLLSLSVSLSYFILAVPMRNCLG